MSPATRGGTWDLSRDRMGDGTTGTSGVTDATSATSTASGNIATRIPGPSTDLQLRIIEAHESERSRLAKEIHDGPAQSLTNAIFRVDYIERTLEQDPKLAKAELGALRDLLKRQLDELRAFISELRPPLLDELGLDGAIRDTVEDMAAVTGFNMSLTLDAAPGRLNEGQQTVILRIVQEALQNVRKHAAANHVTVATRMDGLDWVAEVVDDGLGFDLASTAGRNRRNFGLRFMRDRADLIGARFEVRSSSTAGTVVRVAIPLPSVGEEGG
ncbi:MAG TPA: sensor histidine kinase [Candidatus Limnocylindrales bacterium]